MYEDLWEKNMNLAEQTLKLPFLQHIKLGDLQADKYINFTIQDVWYLSKVTDMLGQIVKKSMPQDLKTFLEKKYESYKKFTTEMLKTVSLNVRTKSPRGLSHQQLSNLTFTGGKTLKVTANKKIQ